jgi:hypothetical protein
MVLSFLHYAPSAVAALLTIFMALKQDAYIHRVISYTTLFFASVGLIGFALDNSTNLLLLEFHSVHAWVGIIALILPVTNTLLRNTNRRFHCTVGRVAAVFSIIALAMGTLILLGRVPIAESSVANRQFQTSSKLPEVETTIFMNQTLMPISQQNNFAIKDTQIIDRDSYRLLVTGFVEKNVTMTYDDLLTLPAYTEVSYLPCVGGWGFYAKWTGFRVMDLLDIAGVKPDGQYAYFKSVDGYTTELPLSYLEKNQTLLAYGLNDVTLPADRGFPLQIVANSKYGYKWAKWIVEIDVISKPKLGFWESSGYSDSADVGSIPLS